MRQPQNHIGSPCWFVFDFLPYWENRKPHRSPKSEKPHCFCQKNEKPDAKKGKIGNRNGRKCKTDLKNGQNLKTGNLNAPPPFPLSIHPITGWETIKARHPIKSIRISWTKCRIYIFARKMHLEQV